MILIPIRKRLQVALPSTGALIFAKIYSFVNSCSTSPEFPTKLLGRIGNVLSLFQLHNYKLIKLGCSWLPTLITLITARTTRLIFLVASNLRTQPLMIFL